MEKNAIRKFPIPIRPCGSCTVVWCTYKFHCNALLQQLHLCSLNANWIVNGTALVIDSSSGNVHNGQEQNRRGDSMSGKIGGGANCIANAMYTKLCVHNAVHNAK